MKKNIKLERKKSADSVSLLRQGLQSIKSVAFCVAIFSFFVNMSVLAIPFYMMQVFDRVLSSHSGSTLVFLTLIVIFVLFIFAILDVTRSWVMVRVANKAEKYLNPRVFNATFERSVFIPGGGHAQGLRDLEVVRNFLSGNGLMALFDAPWIPVFLTVIFLFHPILGTIAITGGLILFLLALVNEFMSRRSYKQISTTTIKNTNFAEASLRNSEAIKAMGMLDNIRRKWQKNQGQLLLAQTRSSESTAAVLGMAKFVRLTMQILIMGTGAYFVIQQSFTPGMMIASAILMGRAVSPLEQAVGQWRTLGMARAAYERLQELLENSQVTGEGLELPVPKGSLAIQQLVIAPPGHVEPVLRGVNLELEPGESLGIFGPSGAGKSSLARVIVGVWPPSAGSVRLDDAEIFTWRSDQLGPYIGYLPQDVELFDGTVAENIARFGDSDTEAIISAARLAGVHEMVLRLPDGYDTLIGEGGYGLSGGQRQRIGLARALFGEPALIVLDEPNSNLDADGEQALIRAMQTLKRKGKTLVAIAHHPKLLGRVDKIMFIRNCKVEAYGPREEIMQKLMNQLQTTRAVGGAFRGQGRQPQG